MNIHEPQSRTGRTVSRPAALALAAAFAVLAPLTTAAAPAAAAPRTLPGQARPGQTAPDPGPAGRVWDSWADDPSTGQVVLFGGDANTHFSNETWAWTGTTWTQLQPAANPGRRGYGALTYDPALQGLVLFGGSNRTKDVRTVWEWNGTTWQQA